MWYSHLQSVDALYTWATVSLTCSVLSPGPYMPESSPHSRSTCLLSPYKHPLLTHASHTGGEWLPLSVPDNLRTFLIVLHAFYFLLCVVCSYFIASVRHAAAWMQVQDVPRTEQDAFTCSSLINTSFPQDGWDSPQPQAAQKLSG